MTFFMGWNSKDVQISGRKETGIWGYTLKFVSMDAAVYVDESDPDNRIVEGLFGIEDLNVDHADFAFNVVAVDEEGNEGKFKIYYVENELGRKMKFLEKMERKFISERIEKGRNVSWSSF